MYELNFMATCGSPAETMQAVIDCILAAYRDNDVKVDQSKYELVSAADSLDKSPSYAGSGVELYLHIAAVDSSDNPVVITVERTSDSVVYSVQYEAIYNDISKQEKLFQTLTAVNNIMRGSSDSVTIPLVRIAGKILELTEAYPNFVYELQSGVCRYLSGGDSRHRDEHMRGCIVGQAIRLATPDSHKIDATMLLQLADNRGSIAAPLILKTHEFAPWSNIVIRGDQTPWHNHVTNTIREVQKLQDSHQQWHKAVKPLRQL